MLTCKAKFNFLNGLKSLGFGKNETRQLCEADVKQSWYTSFIASEDGEAMLFELCVMVQNGLFGIQDRGRLPRKRGA